MVRMHTRNNSPCGASSRARKITVSVICFFVSALFFVIFFSHRMIAKQQNTVRLVKAPINAIERDCPKPTYPTVTSTNTTAGKICMTTLTDNRSADWWQRLIKWRYFDPILQMTWPNKLNYCMKHKYHLYDESELSFDVSRAPSWSKIPAAKRLLVEEKCDWVFWLDADTVIMNSEKRIEDFLPDTNSSIDFVITPEKGKSWNAGAWLIRNTEWSLNFLDDWWNMTDFSKVKGQADAGDNKAVKELLKNMDKADYDEKVATPPRCQFNSVAKFFTPAESLRMSPTEFTNNKRLFLHVENYHKGDFIAHVAGINNKIATTEMLLEDAQ